MSGSSFCNLVRNLSRPARETAIFDAVRDGLLVAWPMVRVGSTMWTSDYLSIGDADDFVRMPCGGRLALEIASLLGMRLPTQVEVDAIYHAADVKLVGRGMGPPYDATMMGIDRIQSHDALIEKDRAGRTGLIAGHRKDVLGVRPRRASDRPGPFDPVLAFYGLFDAQGHAIQHDDGAHEPDYSDGTHAVRLGYDCDPEPRDTDPAPPLPHEDPQ